MAEKLFYYLLAMSLAGGFFFVYNMIVTELRSRRERLERERLRVAYSEIKRLQASNSREQQESREVAADSPEALDGLTLHLVKQLQSDLNQRIMELEREL
jgi:hypothetical protein